MNPRVYQPDKGQKLDPECCVARASDHDSRWPRYYQCSRKGVVEADGHKWCKQHAPKKPTGEFVYVIYDHRWGGTPKLAKLPVTKRTKKQIHVENHPSYERVIRVGDEYNTAADAWREFIADSEARHASALKRADEIQKQIKVAKKELKNG